MHASNRGCRHAGSSRLLSGQDSFLLPLQYGDSFTELGDDPTRTDELHFMM